jgi:hypothetical protein
MKSLLIIQFLKQESKTSKTKLTLLQPPRLTPPGAMPIYAHSNPERQNK